MIFMHFTSQIILLAVGFGVGYAILVTANGHDGRLRTLGNSLGVILIAASIILAVLGCYYSMTMQNRGYMPGGFPPPPMMEQRAPGAYPPGCPMMNQEPTPGCHRSMNDDDDDEMDDRPDGPDRPMMPGKGPMPPKAPTAPAPPAGWHK